MAHSVYIVCYHPVAHHTCIHQHVVERVLLDQPLRIDFAVERAHCSLRISYCNVMTSRPVIIVLGWS